MFPVLSAACSFHHCCCWQVEFGDQCRQIYLVKSAKLLAVMPVACRFRFRGGQTVSFEKRQWSWLLPVSRMLGRWWPHWFHWTQLSQFTANNFIRVKLSRPCLALLHPALSSGQPIFRFLILEGKCILNTIWHFRTREILLESDQLQWQLLYLDCWCTSLSSMEASYTSYEHLSRIQSVEEREEEMPRSDHFCCTFWQRRRMETRLHRAGTRDRVGAGGWMGWLLVLQKVPSEGS